MPYSNSSSSSSSSSSSASSNSAGVQLDENQSNHDESEYGDAHESRTASRKRHRESSVDIKSSDSRKKATIREEHPDDVEITDLVEGVWENEFYMRPDSLILDESKSNRSGLRHRPRCNYQHVYMINGQHYVADDDEFEY